MVYVFDNQGHSMSRFLEGPDAIMPGDILFVKDKTDRERILYLHGVGGYPYELESIDVATDTWFNFIGKDIDVGISWIGNGHVLIPSIKEWAVLYESGLKFRDYYVRGLSFNFVVGELLLSRASKELLENQERCEELYSLLETEVSDKTKRGEFPNLEKKPLGKFSELRARVPRVHVDKDDVIQEVAKKQNIYEHWKDQITINGNNYEEELKRAPYKSLEEIIPALGVEFRDYFRKL